ncbi:MAG: hypothetical protein JWQ89_3444 [Devosia sp.]|uniref:glycoside hydrolase family 19 protein n=1 Tax=Devosia sp. TaxID=1871048 RepID=UPI00261ECF03|nr:glycoside hydrolase family 19 protein [Devosia sp.]MDB5541717.1 hypothetical protein [Devosia sp.]
MRRRGFLAGSTLALLPISTLAQESATACAPDEAGSGLITVEKMARFSPKARSDLLEAIVKGWKHVIGEKIITPIRVHHFLAQIATETGGFARIDENLNYSASRLRKVFKSRVSDADAARLEHKPQAIANHVYGGRLGNTGPNDGWTYRGSGFMQLTGRDNFDRRGKQLGLKLVDDPDQVRQPDTGFKVATSFWAAVDANKPADRDDLMEVRRLINGGKNGLEEAGIWLARARRIFVTVPITPEEADRLDQQELQAIKATLEKLRILEPNPEESGSLVDFIRALVTFRAKEELPEVELAGLPVPAQLKALYDEDVLYALTDYHTRLLAEAGALHNPR